MGNVILGLLISGSLSLYDVRKRFTAGISLFYSASFGGIQRALRQLVSDGHVRIADDTKSARGRKLYSITDDGRSHWRSWMLAPIDDSADAETVVLAKVYLAGLLDSRSERLAVLQTARDHVAAAADELGELETGVAATDVSPDVETVFTYQRATLAYGVRAHALMLAWIDELIAGES